MSRRAVLGGAAVALLLGACSAGGYGGPGAGPAFPAPQVAEPALGTGQVPVALLLPLSGDPALADVGTSMTNAAQLAMDFIAQSEDIGDNIRLTIKDTGATAGGAAHAASAALGEGAKLILGPLKADQVTAAGSVARAAGVPLIGFSNNSGAAGPGVYLLNVLPESEVRRSMAYAQGQGRRAFAGVFSDSDFGRIQEGAFRQAASDLGLNARAVYSFGSEAEARTVVQQLAPLLQQGQIDALFIPDRGTAPSFGVLLEEAGVAPGGVLLIGSADWNGDAAIASTPYLGGAIYPALDDAGYQALSPDYQARFGRPPHALATIAYTAVILANASPLALANPPYDRTQLTLPGGFNGRDGVFRFLPDGRSDYALVIKQVTAGGATTVDGPKLSSAGN
ncbi:MAG TPA: penicillin-binding protein activator [Devosiaceae bacterium]|nr:penicillin-binding protein activator [Devosiaceae bacterium]